MDKKKEKERQKKILEGIIDRKKLTWEGLTYGLQRLDLLIISISGAGIYTCLEFSKFLIEQSFCGFAIGLFKFPALLFVISIVSNLISQFTGYLSNRYDWQMCDKQIDCHGEEIDEVSETDIERFDRLSERYSICTNYLNIASLVLLIVGLGLLIYFFFFLTF